MPAFDLARRLQLPPPPPHRRGARWWRWALALLLAAAPAAADDNDALDLDDATLRPDQTADEWEQSRYTAERVEARVKLFGTWYENYFRVRDEAQATTVNSLSAEGRVTLTLHRERRIKMYLQAIREDFQDADILTSPTYSLGLRADGERHRFDAAFRYLENRESLDIDDLAEPSDIHTYYGAYSLRFAEEWEWALEGELRDQRFPEPRQFDDSKLYSGSTSIRYRGFGRRFSPEIGYESRRREAVDPHDDYDETMPWIKLRFSPFDRLTASLRFRDRRREYSTGDSDDSNFGRVDERDEWTLRADWVVARRLALNLEADWLTSDSTRESRNFTASTLVLGTTVKVGPMRDARPSRRVVLTPKPVAPESARPEPEMVAAPPEPAPPAPVVAAPPGERTPTPVPEPVPATAALEAVPAGESAATKPPVPVAPAPRGAPASARFVAVEPRAYAARPTFHIRVAGELRFSSFTERDPRRFVVDLDGAECAGTCGTLELGSGPVIRIRSVQLAAGPRSIVRVVFDLRDPAARVEVGREVDRVVVRFGAAP
jgi:hypothetical protein